MCDNNLIELLNLKFSEVNDEFNWVNTGSNQIVTESGLLKLNSDSVDDKFRRGIGILDAANNRVKVQSTLEVYRPQTSLQENTKIWFGVYAGNILIDEFSIYLTLETGEKLTYNFDRVYNYEEIGGNISLEIRFTEGFQNELGLQYLKAENYNFCEDNVRTYFAIEDLLENAINSESSAIELLKWEISGQETLTPEFFSENNNPGGNPIAEWKLAKADLDGANREANTSEPNSFNPFVEEWGLQFEELESFFGGKTTGTVSGSDYGQGILNVGFEKPAILNGDLIERAGVFFIDIDYSQNLKVVFNVLVNNNNSNPYDSPDIFRKYTIEWDAENCQKLFYYQDELSENPSTRNPATKDGFLFGLTGAQSLQTVVGCEESFAYNGNSGEFTFEINFGAEDVDVRSYGEIDFESVSIYPAYLKSIAKDTALPIMEKLDGSTWGNNFWYSECDINAVNALYSE